MTRFPDRTRAELREDAQYWRKAYDTYGLASSLERALWYERAVRVQLGDWAPRWLRALWITVRFL